MDLYSEGQVIGRGKIPHYQFFTYFKGAYSEVRIAMNKLTKQKLIFKKYFKKDILNDMKRKKDLINELYVLI